MMKELPKCSMVSETGSAFYMPEHEAHNLSMESKVYDEEVWLRADLAPVGAILRAAYAPGDIVERGGLDDTCSRLSRCLTEKFDESIATAYLAHVLQELRIVDALEQDLTSMPIDMEPLFRALNEGYTPWEVPTRFVYDQKDHKLNAIFVEPSLISVEDLPLFKGELLRGKKVLFVGIGGGSDVIQAAALSEILQGRFGSITTAFASVRKAGNELDNAEQVSETSTSLRKIHAGTSAKGNWRFLENIMLTTKGDPLAKTPIYIVNSIDTSDIRNDLNLLINKYNPDVIIAVDTGGDSLYRTQYADSGVVKATNTTPDQDRRVLEALNYVASDSIITPAFLTAIVAPGVDTPPYAYQALWEADATRLFLSEEDRCHIDTRYVSWYMDGSGNDRNRYGKTSLVWLAALRKRYGLTTLDLPVSNVISQDNPWRTFVYITPAMGEVVLMKTIKHAEVIGLRR